MIEGNESLSFRGKKEPGRKLFVLNRLFAGNC
jgi:hypothetical protein